MRRSPEAVEKKPLARRSDFFIFAGEPSGDERGAEIIKELLFCNPHLRVSGVGGPKMRCLKMECVLPMEAFSVMGFVDVFLSLPRLIFNFFFVKRSILKKNPATVLLIDYPGLNLRLARSLRRSRFQGKICHYVCPSVWAWGKGRIPLMAKNLDLLLTILPFEELLFAKTSLSVRYVGHPLVSKIPDRIKANEDKRLLGIFPGSRKKEIDRNLKKQLMAAKRLLTLDPHLQVALSVASERFLPNMQKSCQEIGIEPRFVPELQTYDLMDSCHLALATSGTVTLELALHGVPTVVTYGLSLLDLFIAKKLFRISLPFYCLVNILAEKEIFPELIGPYFTVAVLFEKAASLLKRSAERALCLEECLRMRELLTDKDAGKEACSALLNLTKKTEK